MLRICIISDDASPLATLGGVDSGGQNVYVANIARQLARRGYAVDVFTRKDDKKLPQVFPWVEGVRIIYVPAGPSAYVRKEDLFQYMDQIADFMKCFIRQQEKPYDLIHANFWMSGYVAAKLKADLQIPFVVTFHALGRVRRIYQAGDDGFPDERFEVEDRVVRQADQIIAECPQDRDDLISLYNAYPNRISTIPCGVDLDEVWPVDKQTARKFLDIREGERVALQLGRMVPRKGVDTAIRGFARMYRQVGGNARMIIVGGESDLPDPAASPEIKRLMQIARAEKVGERVHFAGRKDRRTLKYYYSAADVFVSTPWYEPFGITPLEAMSCKTPVIGSAVGGLNFTIRDGVNGYLVPTNDPEAVADRLTKLLTDPEAYAGMRENAYSWVTSHFTWEKVTRQLESLYARVISANLSVESIQNANKITVQLSFRSLIDLLKESENALSENVLGCADVIQTAFTRGKKILICGNGGSAADAQHFAGELVGRFRIPSRSGLPALALTTDTSILTAVANDIAFGQVFARQVEALGQPGDVLVAISTSGNSKNLIEAFETAGQRGLTRVALLGGEGGSLLPLSDTTLIVPSSDPQRVQEVHILMIHLICELVEQGLFNHLRLNAGLTGRSKAWIEPAGVSLSSPFNNPE